MSAPSPASPRPASPDHRDGSPSAEHDVSASMISQEPASPEHDDNDTSFSSAGGDGSAEKHPKGRRKRTTAEDKRILEEAYRTDAKPDKAARRDIVKRVSLNEREVQIWFQNRRQNDRRKSRPLTAQDIELLRAGGLPLSSDLVQPYDAPQAGASFVSSSPEQASPGLPRVEGSAPAATPMALTYAAETPSSQEQSWQQLPELPSSQESRISSQAFAQSQSSSSSVGYLANRRNLGNSLATAPLNLAHVADGSFNFDAHTPSVPDWTHHRSLSLSKSQSNMRLSLSLEGKAELVSTQLSPVRQPLARVASLSALHDPRPAALRRSSSETSKVTLPPISSWAAVPPPMRLGRGRSRDVQAWESCADAETRDELTAQAEHESNGSAIAEISLLRSAHGVLQPSSGKRNASLTRTTSGGQAKKAKLSRVASSAARLETDEPEKRKEVKSKMDFAVLLSPTDSDKENWSPIGEGNPRQRRPLPGGPQSKTHKGARRQGPSVLGEHKNGPPSLGRAKTAPSKSHRPWENAKTGGVDIFEDGGNKVGEVDKFMAPEVSPSKKGDVDCAVGLLNLAKGAWR